MKPRLDYLTQYPVSAVRQAKNNKGYMISFEGGDTAIAHLRVRTETEMEMPQVEGLSLLKVEETEDQFQLLFGRSLQTADGPMVVDDVGVNIDKGTYTIEDSRYGGIESDPDAPEEDDGLPPDPSPERVADGPTTPPKS